MSKVGIELKIERIKRNMKQTELRDQTGVPQCVISRIENGATKDYPDETKKLQDFFGEGVSR